MILTPPNILYPSYKGVRKRAIGGRIYFTSTCKNLVGKTQSIDLTESWDSEKVLKNPHKGWYHHYFDNRLWE
ncbi:MAG: hypothetical protein N4J56_003195 [Chroococcidiopsis sp. SAG 2025]|nr:hypothetical protein [Chroococcidiopsis sp. SAG 2025]